MFGIEISVDGVSVGGTVLVVRNMPPFGVCLRSEWVGLELGSKVDCAGTALATPPALGAVVPSWSLDLRALEEISVKKPEGDD